MLKRSPMRSHVPLLIMIDLTAAHVMHMLGKYGRYGALGSPALQHIGPFQNARGANNINGLAGY